MQLRECAHKPTSMATEMQVSPEYMCSKSHGLMNTVTNKKLLGWVSSSTKPDLANPGSATILMLVFSVTCQ